MNKVKIIYWTTTILFAAFMIFSAISNILVDENSKWLFAHLGYPEYLIRYIGIAKLLGSIAILIPSFKKIKEWAYAGLLFDLTGAIYSILMTSGWDNGLLTMVPVFGLYIASYIYNDRYYSEKK